MPAAEVSTRIRLKLADLRSDRRIARLNRQITLHARLRPENPTIAFFNASTRLSGVSLNAAFAYLAACGLQLAGYPVVYFACWAGMSRCVLGTSPDDPLKSPPCGVCQVQSGKLFAHAPVYWFKYAQDDTLLHKLKELNVGDLAAFEAAITFGNNEVQVVPLGSLVLPSLRWALRRHQLEDNEMTRFLFQEYILSACRVAREFSSFLDQVKPEAIVLFNGIMYPEATAAWIARRKGLRVVTHEVGFRPFSAFFSSGQATAYPLDIPDEWEPGEDENLLLDNYLSKRFQGDFTMAGIRFWPEMRGLSDEFIQKASGFRQIVPVFTNVIYDTSQVHANTVFPHMFAWLEMVATLIRENPDTLFVIRAHPDEMRPGKQSRENVPDWVQRERLDQLKNVVFIGPNDYISSYELIQRSKFVMVYNSSIGLEASLSGKPVLCGGRARYTPYDTVFFPASQDDQRSLAEKFLHFDIPPMSFEHHRRNARRVMYYQLYHASLPFDAFLEAHPRPGFIRLKSFDWQQLTCEASPTIRVLVDGIVRGKPFVMDNEQWN